MQHPQKSLLEMARGGFLERVDYIVPATATATGRTQPPVRKKGGANHVKHGAYKNVSWDVLEDEDEAFLIGEIDYTPEAILHNNLKNLLLRERRLLNLIKKVKEESADNRNLILGSVTKSKITRTGSKFQGQESTTNTVHEGIFTSLKVYESELTKIQAQKTKIAIELRRLGEENEERKNLANEWISSIIQEEAAIEKP